MNNGCILSGPGLEYETRLIMQSSTSFYSETKLTKRIVNLRIEIIT